MATQDATDIAPGVRKTMEALGSAAAFTHPDLCPYAKSYNAIITAYVHLSEVFVDSDAPLDGLPENLEPFFNAADALTAEVAQAAWDAHSETIRAILDDA